MPASRSLDILVIRVLPSGEQNHNFSSTRR